MSRVGKAPIGYDDKVKVNISASNEVEVSSGLKKISVKLLPEISASIEGKALVLICKKNSKKAHSLHGMYRALLQNAVIGVSRGFTKTLELHGVGYRASVAAKKLEMSLGFSHPISYEIPEGIDIKVEKQTNISVSGFDRALVGAVAAKIRGFRPPEPYLGKGVRYSDEKIRRKAGKSAGK